MQQLDLHSVHQLLVSFVRRRRTIQSHISGWVKRTLLASHGMGISNLGSVCCRKALASCHDSVIHRSFISSMSQESRTKNLTRISLQASVNTGFASGLKPLIPHVTGRSCQVSCGFVSSIVAFWKLFVYLSLFIVVEESDPLASAPEVPISSSAGRD